MYGDLYHLGITRRMENNTFLDVLHSINAKHSLSGEGMEENREEWCIRGGRRRGREEEGINKKCDEYKLLQVQRVVMR